MSGFQKFFILLLIFSYVSGCKNQVPYRGRHIKLSFDEVRQFGQPDSLSKSTLDFAIGAQLGPRGYIYVADAADFKIKVFSPKGQFLNSFGGNGRGPGEFISIRGFALIDSTILVWDQSLQKVSLFTLNGKLKGTHTLKGISTPLDFYSLGDSYLIIHADHHYKSLSKTRLAHIYSKDFSSTNRNFLILKNVNDRIAETSRILRLKHGSLLFKNKNSFLFVPFVYNGKIYEYSKTPDGWEQTNDYKGMNQNIPYSTVNESDTREPDATVSSIYLSKPQRFIFHNRSRGLLKYKNYYFHFTFCDIKNQRVFGVEVYDGKFKAVGYAPIKSIPITNKKRNTLQWFAEHVDQDGNFYFLIRNDRGSQIRVLHVNQEDLKKLSE